LEHGLRGGVIAVAVIGCLHTLFNLALYARVSGGNMFEPLYAARRSIGGIMAMSVYFLLFRPELSAIGGAPLIARLLLDVASGATIYGVTVMALWHIGGRPDGIETLTMRTASRFLAARRA